jgi:hypothetical protein
MSDQLSEEEELKQLQPFCPCRVCTQSWPETFLGFFIHGNCRMCHGCLKAELYFKEHLEGARKRKAEHDKN